MHVHLLMLPAGVFRGRNDAFNVPGTKECRGRKWSRRSQEELGGARRSQEDLQTRSSEEER